MGEGKITSLFSICRYLFNKGIKLPDFLIIRVNELRKVFGKYQEKIVRSGNFS